MANRKTSSHWIALAACFSLLWSCTQPPTLVMKPQPSLIPDGIAISIFTSKPPVTFRSTAGQLVQVPFLATGHLTSKGLTLPSSIHPKRRVQDWVVIPGSGQIAVLTSTERWGLWPPDLIAALSGHPIPHNTFYLELFKATGEPITEARCIKGTYLSGRIEWAP